ncbi:MAG: ATP-binding cassette domain-containing protein, partial [Lachnospiraceae bacterium]|nr:ATP-binding cassette domain-containing protein [Lachnospiraceae bacterium]
GYYEAFTAGAFLMYMAHLKGLDRRTAKSRSQELLQIFNLESARNKRIGGFSGGMKQRLLLAQALLNDPELLILDEPTAGVDPEERIHIRNYISQIATNRIVLLATHIVSDIEAIAKEILLLKSGNVVETDTPGRLIEKVRKYVWNVEIAEAELPDMQAQYLISNLRKNEKGLLLKVISEEPPANARPEKAVNLDDVYLFYITYNG